MPFDLGPEAEQSRETGTGRFCFLSRHDLTMLIFQLTGFFEVKKKYDLGSILPLKTFYGIFFNVLL